MALSAAASFAALYLARRTLRAAASAALAAATAATAATAAVRPNTTTDNRPNLGQGQRMSEAAPSSTDDQPVDLPVVEEEPRTQTFPDYESTLMPDDRTMRVHNTCRLRHQVQQVSAGRNVFVIPLPAPMDLILPGLGVAAAATAFDAAQAPTIDSAPAPPTANPQPQL